MQGNNANPGTQASPKRDLTSVSINSLPAGSRLLLARGGVWANVALDLDNPNVTPANPLVIEAYGTGAAPVLRSSVYNAITMGGRWGNTTNDGGYTLRNIRLDGLGTAERGLWFVQNVRGIMVENVDIENFRLGIESSEGAPYGVTGVTIRNSRINRNRSMGILGGFSDGLVDGVSFEGNNFSGSQLNHAIYYSGGARVTIRNSTFIANSVVNGTCLGGNVTAHGLIDGLLIENNTIRQTAAAPTCYGISITTGYATAEEFRNVVIRGNTVINVGMTSIGANAAPGIVVENNRVINTQSTAQYSIWIPANGNTASPDAADRDAVVRNNTICLVNTQGSAAVSANVPGAVISSNTLLSGAAALTGVCLF